MAITTSKQTSQQPKATWEGIAIYAQGPLGPFIYMPNVISSSPRLQGSPVPVAVLEALYRR